MDATGVVVVTLPSEAVLVTTLVRVTEADAEEGTVVDTGVADADATDLEASMCQR